MPRRTLASLTGNTATLDPTKQPTPQQAVEGVQRKMSFAERQSLQNEIEMTERSLKQLKDGQRDDPRVLKELYRKKMLLAHDDELTFTGASREMAEQEEKELTEKILKGFNGIPGIPSKNEMWPKNDISVKAQALRHNMQFQCPEMDAVVHRWQEVRRRLHPDDPHAQNLDAIRPE